MKTLFALAPLLSPVFASQADYELLANVYKRADIDLTGPGWNDYEAPLSTGGIAWAEGSSRAKKVVSQMTLDEKLMIVTGVDGRCVGVVPNITRLGIPALCLEDGPLGVRPVKGVTQFPSGVTIAATWDKELMYERGKASIPTTTSHPTPTITPNPSIVPKMSFPLLFTLPPSNRHEVLLLDTSSNLTLKALNKQITTVIQGSPNCAEFMSKYKSADSVEQIQEFKIHWSSYGRDTKVWPEYTVVTDENLGALLELLKLGVGKDVLEIKVGQGE